MEIKHSDNSAQYDVHLEVGASCDLSAILRLERGNLRSLEIARCMVTGCLQKTKNKNKNTKLYKYFRPIVGVKL